MKIKPTTSSFRGWWRTAKCWPVLFAWMYVVPHIYASGWQKSDGSAIHLEKKGFSIAPPEGWEYRFDHYGASFLTQDVLLQGEKFQRNIQVMRFATPRFLDVTTAEEFMHLIPERMSAARPDLESYHMRNYQFTELANGNKGILFYAGFTVNGYDMMQAHILTSSSTNAYLATYTDLAKNMDGSEDHESFRYAWSSLTSLDTGGVSGYRYAWLWQGISAIALLCIGIAWFFRYRRRQDARLSDEEHEEDDFLEEDDDDSDLEMHGVVVEDESEYTSISSEVSDYDQRS
ncbi:MAG: hypothetical protein OXT67_03750 [Zetaproteobacteria bacterium]|nr:hypothetical protein [Zetaproteobacteria bacterium]